MVALALVALAGCGLHPMFARSADGGAGPAATELAAISVGIIPERAGQLLRQALQERFERSGLAVPQRYDLVVTFAVINTAVGIQPDTSPTRIRFIGTATYWLKAQDASRSTLTSGTARTVDGFNLFDQQFFASGLEGETVQRRVAEAVADQITLQLASYFDKRATAAAE